MLARRRFLQFSGAAFASALAAPSLAQAATATAATPPERGGDPAAIAGAHDFAALEAASGGRLGVTLLDAAGRRRFGHRQDERFPMCSTFKAALAAAVLASADQGRLSLRQRVPIRAQDLVEHAPVTSRHVGKDLSVRDLCRATVTTSDNPAANLLLGLLGGPPGLTAFLRAHGDAITRSDRREPEMNQFAPGDPRDTTSPAAMAATLRHCALGEVLAPASRQQFADWLIDNQTGDDCLRAGLGPRWRVGDRTGSNGVDTRNDIAVLWPLDGGTPWVLTAYLQGAGGEAARREAVLARVGALAERLIAGA